MEPDLISSAHVSTGSDVLLIGDSHLLLSGAQRSFPEVDLYAHPGRDSTVGLEILETALQPRHRVVVFDLAANDVEDSRAYEPNLEELRERIGQRELVLVNTWRADGRNGHKRVNGILRRFVERHPQRTVLVDWSSRVEAHPSPFGPDPDYIHFTPEVYRDRAELLRRAIASARERAASTAEPGSGFSRLFSRLSGRDRRSP